GCSHWQTARRSGTPSKAARRASPRRHRGAGAACPAASPTSSKAEVFALVARHPDLLDPAPPTVIPQPPPLPAEDPARLVRTLRVFPGADDGVGWVSLPVGDAVLRPGKADLGTVPIREPDVKHDVPIPLPHDLAGRHAILFPRGLRVGSEDRILLVL